MRHRMPLWAVLCLVFSTSSTPAQDSCLPESCEGPGCGGWLTRDEPLLQALRDQPLCGDLKVSAGGELRYRYMDEINRLRPLGELRRDTYQLWRFTPFVEVGNDWRPGPDHPMTGPGMPHRHD